MPVVGELPISVSCVDDSAMFVTVLSGTVSVGNGQSSAILQLTAPPHPATVTCTLAVMAGGDPVVFRFLTERPTIAFYGIQNSLWPNGIAVLKTGSTHHVSIQTSHRVEGAPVRVNVSCTAGTMSAPTFVLASTTYDILQYTAPSVPTDAIVCFLSLLPGSDPRFAGLQLSLPPVRFAADTAPTLAVAMAPQLATAATETVSLVNNKGNQTV